ncbi:glutamine--fructose-6-phosphate transaminase (isomerizing) [Nitrincola alkalisediminis]|uniref:glutamine--fructose-6-phosphate transaminase (isomerizing) n=1 Tax=Nitrincola alkalisediminis TaxID=1366656 RepID=UPI0018771473|nr:glutamine--fructose-6-phosphate transaminase (isomerizing) [Nitrincola alkalisediminis]
MCGIVAANASVDSIDFLISGLKQLEYRGYDSAGLAVLGEREPQRYRALGRVAELEALTQAQKAQGALGIAHTRWATHGVPAERNAHPHISGKLALVHNGIIENYAELKAQLQALGYEFTSDTDTETVAHLIEYQLKSHPDLLMAVQVALTQVKGAYALAIIHQDFPDQLIVAREGSPLMLGIADNGIYAASDASALISVTRRLIYLENGDIVRIQQNLLEIHDAKGKTVERTETLSQLSASAVELGPYQHFMQKEMFEQPQALGNTLEMLSGMAQLDPGLFGAQAADIFSQVDSVLIVACGTSSYAGMTAKYWIEDLVGIPCSVEIASEYRYRKTVANPNQLVVVISQSGETADTLAALQEAKALGHKFTLAICNVPESAIVRETALRFITRAGPEIGVASTKAFTTQLATLFVLTLVLAKKHGRLCADSEQQYLQELLHLPLAVEKVLALEPEIKNWSGHFADKHHALFLGRGYHYPIALEGALKLKEISYIHAEAYPAGELKHGPLALVDANMPVVIVAPNDSLLDKLKANMQEVSARGGVLYVFADADTAIDSSEGIVVLKMPEHYGLLSPVLHVVALQLLAYHVALVKGTDVDKPRNLAKSVTVE